MKVNQGAEIANQLPNCHILLQQHPREPIQLHLVQLKYINIQQIGYNYKIPVYSLNTEEQGVIQHMLKKLGLGPNDCLFNTEGQEGAGSKSQSSSEEIPSQNVHRELRLCSSGEQEPQQERN